jgi:hypothetical protein
VLVQRLYDDEREKTVLLKFPHGRVVSVTCEHADYPALGKLTSRLSPSSPPHPPRTAARSVTTESETAPDP